MQRILFTAIAAALLGGIPARAQEPPAPQQAAEAREKPPSQQAEPAAADKPAAEQQAEPEKSEKSAGAADASGAPDADEKTVLDDQTFEGEDDEFIPTEEIPVSEPIPFPVDI